MVNREIGGVARRDRALPLNISWWALLCALVVVAGHAFTAGYGRAMGPYRSGIVALVGFVIVGWYSVRKRSLWFSVRVLRTTQRLLPDSLQRFATALDRLETWRAVHVTLGVLVLLPLWWHCETGLMSPLELLLAIAVALLILSGVFGVVVQDFLPHSIQGRAEHEVRLRDIDARISATYVEAEEKILGHSEELTTAYTSQIKPLLNFDLVPQRTLLLATLRGVDAGSEYCAPLFAVADRLKTIVKDPRILESWDVREAPVWKELAGLAVRKVNLDHNAFNLRFSTGWLEFHIVLALATLGLLIFHVLSALYFYGL